MRSERNEVFGGAIFCEGNEAIALSFTLKGTQGNDVCVQGLMHNEQVRGNGRDEF